MTPSLSETECYADKCSREAKVKGLCQKHYMRLKRTGTLLQSTKKPYKRGKDFYYTSTHYPGSCDFSAYNELGTKIRPHYDENYGSYFSSD